MSLEISGQVYNILKLHEYKDKIALLAKPLALYPIPYKYRHRGLEIFIYTDKLLDIYSAHTSHHLPWSSKVKP
jgi:hypothetical protein